MRGAGFRSQKFILNFRKIMPSDAFSFSRNLVRENFRFQRLVSHNSIENPSVLVVKQM